jgi:hypothetical protein
MPSLEERTPRQCNVRVKLIAAHARARRIGVPVN